MTATVQLPTIIIMMKAVYKSLANMLVTDAGRGEALPDIPIFPFGMPPLPLSAIGDERNGERLSHSSSNAPFAAETWQGASFVVIDGAPKDSPDVDRPIIESLKARGFTGKINRESAYLLRAIESLVEGGILIDSFSPHLLYGSSALDRALREMLSTKVALLSVTSFEAPGDGTDDREPRVIIVLRREAPSKDHTILFRRLGHNAELLMERKVPIEEMQNASVWIPDRFFIRQNQYLNEKIHTVQLGSLCRDIFRGAPGRFFSKEGKEAVRYLSLKHVGAGLLDVNDLSTMQIESVSRIKRYLLRQGDVIVSCRGEFFRPLLLTGTSTIPVTGGDNYVIIRPDLNLVDPGFLFRYLRSRAGQAFLFGMSTGKRIRVLNVRAMAEIPVPLPSMEMQQRVAVEFTNAERLLEEERNRIEEEYRNSADVLFQGMGLLPAGAENDS